MSDDYPYKAWMLNKEWQIRNPYQIKNGNTVISTSWYQDFSGKTSEGSTTDVIYMDNDNTTTGTPLYYSADEKLGQLYLHPYDGSITPCTSSTTYTTSYETKSGSLTVSRSSYQFFTPKSRTYPSSGIGSNNYYWFCGWGTEKTGTTLEVVSGTIHSFTKDNWPSSFEINPGDTTSVIYGNTNTAAYCNYQKISGSYSLYTDDGTLLSDLNDAIITSATVNLQKIVCKYTPSTRVLTAGTTVSWSLADSWAVSLGTETVNNLSDSYTVYCADKWSRTLDVSVSLSSGLKYATMAATFVEIMSSVPQYAGDLYAVFVVPMSATVNYTYKQKVTTTSTTSSVANNVASYIEVGSSLINLKSQIKLFELISENNDPYQYGYVIRKTAKFPNLTLTAQSTISGAGGIPICVQNNMFYGNGTQSSNSATGVKTWGYCGYTTRSSQTLYSTDSGLGQVLCYWQGISNAYVDNSTDALAKAQSDCANYIISNKNTYSSSNNGYFLGITPVNFNLLYNGSTVLSFLRSMPTLYRYIMYKPSSNKAVALYQSNTFKLKRSTLSANNGLPVYVNRYNSSGALVETINVYSSDINVTMNENDYLTISGMGSTTLSGPSTSTSQSATVTISSVDTGGSSVNNKDTSFSPGTAILTSSVTTKVHSAKVRISVSLNSDTMSYVSITSNEKTYSNTGSETYYAPTVTRLETNTKAYSGWSVEYCYRTVLSYYDTYWKKVVSGYTYLGGSSSSSSTTSSGYLPDVYASVSWEDNYGEIYYVQCGYESSRIKAPIIKTCTDAGSWQRYITIYNPNEVSLEFFYTSNKTTSKSRANSIWKDGGSLAAGATSSTYTITDQSGFSDEWIIAGFRLASNYYICTTIDEDVTSGTPNVVNDSWYYTD